jgi:hypothetical protein
MTAGMQGLKRRAGDFLSLDAALESGLAVAPGAAL